MADVRAKNPLDGLAKATGGTTPGLGWLLVAIIVFSTVLDLALCNGHYSSDDLEYFSGARQVLLAHQLQQQPDLAHTRLGMLGWNALLMAFVGSRIQLVSASYIIFHQIINLATFLLGRRLWNTSVGLLAAYLVGTMPLLVLHAGMILPDMPVTAYLTLALLAFIAAYDYRKQARPVHAGVSMLLAGVLVGLAYITKETALVTLPFFFFMWLVMECWQNPADTRRASVMRAVRSGAPFAAGFALMFVGEWCVFRALIGQPFFRLGYTFDESDAGLVSMVSKYGTDPLERWGWVGRRLNETYVPVFLKWLALFSLLVYPFLKGRRWSVYLLPLWLFVYLTWGSASLTHYSPPSIQTRYYALLAPFVALVIAYVLWWLWAAVTAWLRSPWLRRPLLAVFLIALVAFSAEGLQGADNWAGRLYRARWVNPITRATSEALAQSERPVVLSGTASRILQAMVATMPAERVKLCAELTVDEFHEMALNGGLTYIECSDDAVREGKRKEWVTDLDRLLHAVIKENSGPVPTQLGDELASVVWSPDPVFPHGVQVGRRLFWVHEQDTCFVASSRLHALQDLVIGEGAAQEVRPHGATRYVVIGTSAPRTAQAIGSSPHGSSPHSASGDLSESFRWWRVWHAENYQKSLTANGTCRLGIEAPDRGYAWFVLPRSRSERFQELAPGNIWCIEAQVAMEGELDVELVLTFGTDQAGEHCLATKRLTLRNRLNRLTTYAAVSPLYVSLAFKIRGKGMLTVEKLRIVGQQWSESLTIPVGECDQVGETSDREPENDADSDTRNE